MIDYIRIPCKSPQFDKEWRTNGHIDKAIELIERWCKAQPIPGLQVEVLRPKDRTPLIYMEIPGIGAAKDDTVLLYGHMDKQPEMTGWEEGLGPWTPVMRDGKLYGRGGADDGYSAFASLAAIRALHEQKLPHARCVVNRVVWRKRQLRFPIHRFARLAHRQTTFGCCLDSARQLRTVRSPRRCAA